MTLITKIIKRDGTEADFNTEKIRNAITRANAEVEGQNRMSAIGIDITTRMVVRQLEKFNRAVEVEEIQEIVETELMVAKAFEVAKCYIRYCWGNLKRHNYAKTSSGVSCKGT